MIDKHQASNCTEKTFLIGSNEWYHHFNPPVVVPQVELNRLIEHMASPAVHLRWGPLQQATEVVGQLGKYTMLTRNIAPRRGLASVPGQDEDTNIRYIYSRAEALVPMELVPQLASMPQCRCRWFHHFI